MVHAIIRTKLEGSISDSFDFRPKGIREPLMFCDDLPAAERRRGPHQAEENALSESRESIEMNDDLAPLETHPGNRSIEQCRQFFAGEPARSVGEMDREWGMDVDRSNRCLI